MKRTLFLLMALALFCGADVQAEEDIAGIWEGALAIAPGSELRVQFKIKRTDDGSFSALINSPDQGALKNTPASSVSYEGNHLKIIVQEVNGSFEGTVGDREITGKWSQLGTDFPLTLRPFAEPVLSAEAMALLAGKWQGKLESPIADFDIVFRFETSDSGSFVGLMDVPAQGARGIPVSDIKLKEKELSLSVAPAMARYTGTLTEQGIDGKWIQGAQEIPLKLRKGVEERKAYLALSKESFDALAGHWNGKLAIPQGPLQEMTIVLRFEKTGDGDVLGFMDAPDQGTTGLPIPEASIEDGAFSFRIPGIAVEYKGKLSEGKLIGEYTQAGRKSPLTMERGKASVKTLALSSDAMAQLKGKWGGRVDMPQTTLRVVFRFTETDEGEPLGYLDSPDQGKSGIPITEASMANGSLTVKVDGLMVEYKGKLSGNAIVGQLIQAGRSFDMTLEKVK